MGETDTRHKDAAIEYSTNFYNSAFLSFIVMY